MKRTKPGDEKVQGEETEDREERMWVLDRHIRERVTYPNFGLNCISAPCNQDP